MEPLAVVVTDPTDHLADHLADRLIVALDGMDGEQALAFVEALPGLRWVKVGLALFTSAGPEVVARLRGRGLRVFLDLKFHDIPATMAGACHSAARLGVELLTVHAAAGSEALAAARTGARDGAASIGLEPPTLLAVTVLTSWAEERWAGELAISEPLPSHVERLAALAAAAGIGGCVCSPLELASLRRRHPDPFVLVTPGIRPAGSEAADQARVMGPGAALAAGASLLVIGRPITAAADPAAAFAACCAEMAAWGQDPNAALA